MSEVRFTPRTPTGPSPAVFDQVSELERRLQSSITLTMEEQFQRLSGEVLDILRSQQKTSSRIRLPNGSVAVLTERHLNAFDAEALRAHAVKLQRILGNDRVGAVPTLDKDLRAWIEDVQRVHVEPLRRTEIVNHGSRQVKSLRPSGQDITPPAPMDMPPLLKPVTNTEEAVPQKRCLHSKKSQESTDEIRPALSECTDMADYGAAPTVLAARTSDGADQTGTESRRPKLTASQMNGDTVLADLLQATEMRQREKRVQAAVRSKFRSKEVAERNSITGELIQENIGKRILKNPVFDSVCAIAIVLNSILIGFSVQWLTEHEEETVLLITLGHMCSAFFFFELTFRLSVYRLTYFQGEDQTWNLFDFALVVFSVVDFIMWATIGNEGAGSVGSTLKIVKMLRIVRIFRVFRFFKELSLLALMIMDSLRSLVWALLMLIIIIYVFAICFTQSATDFRRDIDQSNMATMDFEVENLFGSLPRTIYSLVNSMLGGVSWGVVSDALMHMDAFSAILFFFYICFSVLAVLNIITGVFVDNAVETAKTEREFRIQKETELREKLLDEMRQLFSEMDEDNSGAVSLEELQSYFDDDRVQIYFQALGLDPTDAERLFRLIDTDNSGEVQVAEFLDGCLRLKGEARSIDVNAILWQCRQIQTRLDKLGCESSGIPLP